jgi:hypothetical protein
MGGIMAPPQATAPPPAARTRKPKLVAFRLGYRSRTPQPDCSSPQQPD